jgi:predicted ATPase
VFCIRIDSYPDAISDTAEEEDTLPTNELENFADWYRHLVQADPVANATYLKSLAETMNGFDSLKLEQIGSNARILRTYFLQNGKGPFPYLLSELSDGQRYLMILYALLHFVIAKSGNTVFIDEPDNYVALREIQPWLLAAEDAVQESHGQLILISHHPELLNYWAKDYGLLFFREENGHARTKPYSSVTETGLTPAETIARGWENE